MEYVTFENRDVRCAADVGRMAELGRFDTEFDVYGSAVQLEDGKLYYYATSDEEKLYSYMQQQRFEERYFTPIQHLSKRTKVPAGMKEQLLYETKYELLQSLKKDYEESSYFMQIMPFCQTAANNAALPLLEIYQEKIDGHFDDRELQLFLGMIKIAYEAKVVTKEQYQKLNNWYEMTRQQMADDPVVEDQIGRTFYGFVYLSSDGHKRTAFDAQKMTVVHQWQEKLMEGVLLGPIVEKTYWFQQFNQLSEIRKQYRDWLLQGQDDAYFQLLQAIKQVPGVIDKTVLQKSKEKMTGHLLASQGFSYYDALWNGK